ncbi:MAG TPA: glycosyltransferase [Acetobacteraceae bacterium]|nr:glycosyltransferase [Acetobacteraceae bacterium]
MPPRARVLHIFKIYRPRFTGEGVFLERHSPFMQILAPEVEHDLLVTTTPEPTEPQPVCSALSRIQYLTKRPVGNLRREWLLVWWFIRNLHRYHTVHVRVHADWYFLTYILCKLAGRRLVLSATLQDSVPVHVASYRAVLRPLARRLFRMFDAYVSISPKLQAETSSVVPPERCHLVPCGITFPPLGHSRRRETRDRLGIPDDALVLIFVGGLCERKDPMLQVRVFPDLLRHRPDLYLLLVGPELEPDYVSAMRDFIQAEGLDQRIIFVGEVPDPYPYFEAADIMTFASHLEGFGTVVPEAMINGLPVVARLLPGVNDDFVKDGETGYLFSRDTEFPGLVLKLANDADLRLRLGQAGRDLVRRSFDMRQVARSYLEIYGFSGIGEPPSAAPSAEAAWEEVIPIKAGCSIISPRFHAPARFAPGSRPMLVTIIDAEEAFDWGLPFSRSAIDVTSMGHQGPAHRIFERYGIVPLYAVDYPVTTQEAGAAPLRELLQDRLCDIGTQLHPWVTPPYLEDVTARNSYPGSLPLTLEFEKIRLMTEAIEDAFGVRPQIYRAGRYGAGPRTGDILKHLGYLVDSSVMPVWSFAGQEGPDYTMLPAKPYWIDPEQTVLEMPGSAAIVGHLSDLRGNLRHAVFSGFGERIGIPSVMARLRCLERIKLTPEAITIPEAKRLVRHMLAHDHKVFVLTYHTPSLVPGNTPYVRTQEDLRRFLAWLDEFFDFFTREVGGSCVGWRDVRAALVGKPGLAVSTSLETVAM